MTTLSDWHYTPPTMPTATERAHADCLAAYFILSDTATDNAAANHAISEARGALNRAMEALQRENGSVTKSNGA